MKALRKLESYLEWLLSDAYRIEAEGLAVYRILYGVFLVFFGVPGFTWVGRNPDVFFRPPFISLPRFVADGFPSTAFLLLLSAGVCLCLLLIAIGRFTPVASVLFSFFAVVGFSFAFSFGKIDHHLIVWALPAVMAWSGWGRRHSLDARRAGGESSHVVRGAPVALVGLLVAFCMCTAGVQKILGGWLDLGSRATYGHIYQAVYVFEREPLLGSLLLGIDSDLLWEVLDYLVVAFEVGFLFSFFRPFFFRFFLIGAFAFHFVVFLTMGIRLEILTVVYLLILVDWEALVHRVRRLLRPRILFAYFPSWGVWLVSAIALAFYLWGQLRLAGTEAYYLSVFDFLP